MSEVQDRKRHSESDRHSKKRHKHHRDSEDGSRKHKRKKHSKESKDDHLNIVDDDVDDDDMWVEKNIDMDGERVLATNIPTAESLKLTSKVSDAVAALPAATSTESKLQRDEWMLLPPSAPTLPVDRSQALQDDPSDDPFTDGFGEPSQNSRTTGGGVDFFSALGTEHKKKEPKNQLPDPDKPKVNYRELNQDIVHGRQMNHDAPPPPEKAVTPGGPGSQWRMMRLRRVYETVEEEGLPLEQVAIERFGTLEAFEDAQEERRILDEREGKRAARGRDSTTKSTGKDGEKGFMFTDIGGSGTSSRSSSFRRPGESAPSTPSPAFANPQVANRRLDSLRLPSQAASPLAQSHTPIPSVFTPPATSSKGKSRALSPSSLNRLQAKVLRAKLLGAPNAADLEREYESESRKAMGGEGDEPGQRTKVEVLPTMDAHGRLYDVGHGAEDDSLLPGNRKKKEKFETRDPKTGDIVRYNADDDTVTLGEMLRQEKFGAGMADQKDLDAQFAKAIMGDGKFENDLDYMDDNAEKLGRQKMRSDAMKRQFAIHDYKRTQQALSSCQFCFGEDDSPPKAPVVAMGTRVYLSCTVNDELVKGHCLIVPIQHHLSMLEGDDDVWDEVRNFMKCLMRMFAEEDQGVIFYETVISLKKQRHTVIECVPLPWDKFEDIPGYFKESILTSEAEWSQHKKLIDFSARPGGFRRAMVPNLPYFMVQFDHKGEKGYGHVIEGSGGGGAEDNEDFDEGAKGGGDFPVYFAGEIIGNLLDLEPRKWRRPRRIDSRSNKERVAQFRKTYDKFDWTGMIGRGS
ncbi:hypothetical protein HGRIS_003724 [Hohenbuehelia grisea]|uniref:Uncharacterized protein n=1 Tax=Hohenbuehelia grisea TaxID=104357 RepID=A0ABR3JGM2_9AGAR